METALKEKVQAEGASVLPDAYSGRAKAAPGDRKAYLVAKRALDIVGSVLGLVIMAIPMLIIALLIRIDTPGPAIYSQERVGKDGKEYIMYKFRSMRMDAEKNGPAVASENDNRCTKIGAFIRLYHIDELPQLWNVLVGDMSIVGPRPERAYYYKIIEQTVPDFRDRLEVKPGLTGLAQVKRSYDVPHAEKLRLDKEYINNMSMLLDLKIMLETVGVVITHKGAR